MKPINSLLLQYKEFILESQTVLDYLIIAWIHILGSLAITGLGKVIYELITNPTQFNDVTWGIFDTLG